MRSHSLRPFGGGWFSHRVFGAYPDRSRETARMFREAICADLSAEWPDGFADAETGRSDIRRLSGRSSRRSSASRSGSAVPELASQFGMQRHPFRGRFRARSAFR
jgi:hypothetical protein